MDKITFTKAIKMCRDTGHTLWHIKWYPPLEREHPDCSHFVVSRGGDHRERKYHLALVIRNERAERRHRLQELRKEGRNAMAEILEEQWQAEEAEAGDCF